MRPQQITREQLASETRISLEHITEILETKRDITRDIAERIERRFGWPAKVLLDWQHRYDEAVVRWGLEYLADAAPYRLAEQSADLKKHLKTVKKYGARLIKLAHARLRARTH
jgi:plasmid maintenance system antidote protein VapI